MTILVAADGQNTPDRVVEIGADLANAYNDQLVVLHVHEEDSLDEGSLPLDAGAYTYDNSVEEDEEGVSEKGTIVARNVVDKTLDAEIDADARGRAGKPEEVILAEAQEIDARYLVVGGRRRSPVGKALFGSTTQSVLLDAEIPVVTVKTE